MAIEIPVVQTIGGLLNQGPAETIGGPDLRTGWVFSSTLRRLAVADPNVGRTSVTAANDLTGVAQFARTFASQRGFISDIVMEVNPSSVQFQQTKRIVKKDTRRGSVYFHFSDDKGQNNDILVITFRGNAGNIDLRGSVAQPGNGDTGARDRLIVWHNLYSLTREPVLIASRLVNEFTISYSSPAIRVPVTFTGFYSKVLEFTEDALKPNSIEYNFEFTVTRSEPDMGELVGHISEALDSKIATALNPLASLFTSV